MSQFSPSNRSCKGPVSSASPFKALVRVASTKLSTPTRLVSQISAIGLVLASAGFGAVFAWITGSEHGVILGGLFVLMAVSLECAKPLAVATALSALRTWSLFLGGSLALLAAVAIAYSLTSELTLMAGARGDLVAERAAKLKASADAAEDARHARERYEAAKDELATLPAARPVAELQKQINDLLLTPGADGCAEINGKITRTVCPLVAGLKAEKARAERRATLEAILAQPPPVIAAPKETHVAHADPGASALSAYLAALGFKLPADTITDWLALVPVLALEVGSALAGVLAMSMRPDVSGQTICEEVKEPQPSKVHGPAKLPVTSGNPASATRVKRKRKRARKNDRGGQGGSGSAGPRMPANVIDLLRQKGGRIEGGQRGIGKLLGLGKSRANELLHELATAGAVILNTTRAGTTVELVAA